MKKTSGFTLIELMIVVAIIAIIAAIAIPNLLRSRIQSNESAAIGNLRTITGAQTGYSAANGNYAVSIAELLEGQEDGISFLLGAWGGTKSGYTFTVVATAETDGSVACYESEANPSAYGRTGIRNFFSDCSGVIRFTTADASATVDDAAIGDVGTPAS